MEKQPDRSGKAPASQDPSRNEPARQEDPRRPERSNHPRLLNTLSPLARDPNVSRLLLDLITPRKPPLHPSFPTSSSSVPQHTPASSSKIQENPRPRVPSPIQSAQSSQPAPMFTDDTELYRGSQPIPSNSHEALPRPLHLHNLFDFDDLTARTLTDWSQSVPPSSIQFTESEEAQLQDLNLDSLLDDLTSPVFNDGSQSVPSTSTQQAQSQDLDLGILPDVQPPFSFVAPPAVPLDNCFDPSLSSVASELNTLRHEVRRLIDRQGSVQHELSLLQQYQPWINATSISQLKMEDAELKRQIEVLLARISLLENQQSQHMSRHQGVRQPGEGSSSDQNRILSHGGPWIPIPIEEEKNKIRMMPTPGRK